MKNMDHVEPVLSPAGDPLDAIVTLAVNTGAVAVARDAQRAGEQLGARRFCVAFVVPAAALTMLLEHIVKHPVNWKSTATRPLIMRFGLGGCLLRLHCRDGQARYIPGRHIPDLEAVGESVISIELLANSPLLAQGICCALGTPDTHWPSSLRIDLLVVDKAMRRRASKMERSRGLRTIIIDTERAEERERAFELACRLAREEESNRVEGQLAENNRFLCQRLRRYMFEQQRALGQRSQAATARRLDTLTIARTIVGSLLEARSQQPHPEREQLSHRLDTARMKFLMSAKADAVAVLERHLGQSPISRKELRCKLGAVTDAILDDHLAVLWQRLSALATASFNSFLKRLIDDVKWSLGELADATLLDVTEISAMSEIRTLPSRIGFPSDSGVKHLADRLNLASRSRIEHAARNRLVARLDDGSRHVTMHLLAEYDDCCGTLERRLCQLFEDALEGAKIGAELAARAHANDTIVDASRTRLRLARLSVFLSEIVERLA